MNSSNALARRARSHARLEAEGIPYNPDLKLLPGEGEATLPGAEDVTLRALALTLVASEATGMGEQLVDKLIDEYHPPFSPDEWRWFESPSRGGHESVEYGWRFEAALPLFWSAGFVETLERPERQIPPFELMQRIVHYRREELLARAGLRPAAEILDCADLHFRYEYASRIAHGEGQPAPGGLDGGVLVERHRAFTWLLAGGATEWDEVVRTA